MNKEENIKKIQDQIDKVKEYIEYGMPYSEYLDLQLAFDDIVNLIQKQESIIDKIWDLYYEYLSIRPASGMKFLKSKGFDVSKCEKCSFDDDNINCKECIKEYFKKEAEKDEART